MGLGPPVCEKCQVIGELSRDFDKPLWSCPICGNTDMQWSAWSCGISEEQLETNLRLMKFISKVENHG